MSTGQAKFSFIHRKTPTLYIMRVQNFSTRCLYHSVMILKICFCVGSHSLNPTLLLVPSVGPSPTAGANFWTQASCWCQVLGPALLLVPSVGPSPPAGAKCWVQPSCWCQVLGPAFLLVPIAGTMRGSPRWPSPPHYTHGYI